MVWQLDLSYKALMFIHLIIQSLELNKSDNKLVVNKFSLPSLLH